MVLRLWPHIQHLNLVPYKKAEGWLAADNPVTEIEGVAGQLQAKKALA
jgi:hypothetical protein